jgi:hypothetical protein
VIYNYISQLPVVCLFRGRIIIFCLIVETVSMHAFLISTVEFGQKYAIEFLTVPSSCKCETVGT